jgi:hypothetical protein
MLLVIAVVVAKKRLSPAALFAVCVLEEIPCRKGTRTAERLKLVLDVIEHDRHVSH